MTTTLPRVTLVLPIVAALLVAMPATSANAAEAEYHHVHITSFAPAVSVRWYEEHLDCQPIADRDDAADCHGVEVTFVPQATQGSTQGTGVNHISFSYPDLTAKMEELESVGSRGSGVRLQRFEGGEMVREAPGLFKYAFIFDPWGTRIELVEDSDYLGFHHIHLSSTDPDETLAWYQSVLGGERDSLRGQLDGLRYGDVWLLAMEHEEGIPATTEGRAIDHIGFVVDDLGNAANEMRSAGAEFQQDPTVPENARTSAQRAFLYGPDNVRLAVVESGFAGVDSNFVAENTADSTPYDAVQTPWGEPDLQGVWTGNPAHGIPLERPLDLADVENLTAEEAAGRREGGTLGSIWGYEREWRDTTLGYDKNAPSTQVAMIIDPPNGRLPERTPDGQRMADEASRAAALYTENRSAGPEDLTPYVRCITRGLPGLMMPSIYNNGLQIVQGPGFVAIQKEMIHETRVIPTEDRTPLDSNLKTYLGDPQGHWEGNTLVVETNNFNGKTNYRGSSADMKLTERFTRTAENRLEYQFTVNDPTVWTQPWTGVFTFNLDNEQYDVVEYACHEGNYGMFNILSGARALDKERAEGSR
jgi:catechol 2,3-dioxygenase-like lactoylglutathione lyase family enzyme